MEKENKYECKYCHRKISYDCKEVWQHERTCDKNPNFISFVKIRDNKINNQPRALTKGLVSRV